MNQLYLNKIKFKTLEIDSDLEGVDYELMIKNAKNQYNLEDRKIAFNQVFTSTFIRKANEYLQACIDYKRVWFASRTASDESSFNETIGLNIPLDLMKTEDKKDWTVLDFIENQDDFIYQTKKQCVLIEHSTTSRGTQSFDLPQHLKRSASANKARKDNYSAFMLANWAVKCYNDMMETKNIEVQPTFSPIMIR